MIPPAPQAPRVPSASEAVQEAHRANVVRRNQLVALFLFVDLVRVTFLGLLPVAVVAVLFWWSSARVVEQVNLREQRSPLKLTGLIFCIIWGIGGTFYFGWVSTTLYSV